MNLASLAIVLLAQNGQATRPIEAARLRDPLGLAFSARLYFPDRRRSRLRLYVSDLRGLHRREIKTSGEPWGVRWSGRNWIVWVEGDYVRGSLMVATGPSWRPRVLRTASQIVPEDSETVGTRGIPRYRILDRLFEVRLGKLRPIRGEPLDFSVDRGFIQEREGRVIEILDSSGGKNSDPAVLCPVLSRDGVKVPIDAAGFLLDAYQGKSSDETWVSTWEQGELHAEFTTLTAVNWKTKTSKVIVARVAGEDISRFDPIYATLTRGGRSLEYWEPLHASIWISGIEVGNYDTGERWSVLGGWVYANSVSVRPTARDIARRKP